MFKFLPVTLVLIILASSFPVSAKPKPKPQKLKPLTIPPVVLDQSLQDPTSKLPIDIRQAMEAAKKYKRSLPTEKSQLETQAQYEARLASSPLTNPDTIEVEIPVSRKLKYDADDQKLIVSMDTGFIPGLHDGKINPLKSDRVQLSSISENVTCTNGYGAKFRYRHDITKTEYYGITYYDKEIYLNKNDISWADTVKSSYDHISKYGISGYGRFDFAISIPVSEVRNFLDAEEKMLNDKLKFVVTLKPVLPFYKKSSHYFGNACGTESSRGGYSSTSYGDDHYAIFDIKSLKLIDSFSGRTLLERNYSESTTVRPANTVRSVDAPILTPNPNDARQLIQLR